MALLLRLAVAVSLRGRVPADDEVAYDELARHVLAGRGFTTDRGWFVNPGRGAPTSLWGCLQPLWLAGVYTLCGVRPFPVYVANALIGLVPVWAAAALGARLGGRWTALVAGLVVALDAYLLKFTATLLSEPLFIALLWTALVAAVRWAERPSSGRAAATGLLLGLASLSRGIAFWLAPVALLWALLERGRRSGRVRETTAFTLALLAAIAPWVVRNRRVHDRPVFLDTKAGWNLYSYLHPEFEPLRGNPVPVPPEVLDPQTSESRRNEILRERAARFVRDDPGGLLRKVPAKLWLLWSPFAGRGTDPALAPVKLLFIVSLELAALAGALRARARTPVARLLWLLAGYWLLVHSVMTGGPRFRTPLDPALALFAGALVAPRAGARAGQSSTSPSTPA